MRGRASFVLTALALLFLLQSLSVLLATLYATAHGALFPAFDPLQLLPALLPLSALFAPLLLARVNLDRHRAFAMTVIVIAVARVPLSLPWHEVRLVAAAIITAAGGAFIACAVGYVERRRVAGGLAAAITLEQLLRLAGWSWDLSLRSWWVAPQLVISALMVALALAAWRRSQHTVPGDEHGLFERRAGGLRLRGALALGLLLFLDLHVLARAEVAAHWPGVRYELAAVLLIGAGTLATLLLLAGHAPIGVRRRSATLLALTAGAAVLLAPRTSGLPGLLLMSAGHVAALLLMGRALVPGPGRRVGRNATAALLAWAACSALYVFTFFPSFTIAALHGRASLVFGAAALLLLPPLILLPRPVETPPPLRGRLVIALTLVLALAGAVALGLRQRVLPTPAAASAALRVATFNVHHGFSAAWRFGPARIADEIEAADADIVALQEVGAGLPTAYGVDLVLYLSRRLRVPAHFSPTHNGLMGDALLTRVAVADVRSVPLPDAGVDARELTRFVVSLDGSDVTLLATRLGLSPPEQAAQVAALARTARIAGASASLILLGDLNAEPDSPTLRTLRAAGFEDAFALARAAPGPTSTAHGAPARIDWIMLRNLDAETAAVLDGGGSDHQLVVADIRLR
jgi:endonuclease/exonuclease/phosphatase family metal-dependent hydrolase